MQGKEGHSGWCERGHGSGRKQIVGGFVEHGKEAGCYSDLNGKTMEGPWQRNNTI